MQSRVLILGDIHANPIALGAVLFDAGKVDRILCTGDLVDYNPWPSDVLEMVREFHINSVIGNHDRDCARGTPRGYNPYARRSCMWTHDQLTEEDRDRLATLPEKIRAGVGTCSLFLCHGSPRDLVDEYVFPPPETPRELLREFLQDVHSHILVMGHTHVPFIEVFPEGWVMNPGSVGQPRDRDPRASYAILMVDGPKIRLSLYRVEYDVDVVCQEITTAGLPSFLAERLHLGI